MHLQTVNSPDRLALMLFLAAVVHGLVILGVGISSGISKHLKTPPLIEITLATLPSEKIPERHDFLAQANQQGGGESERRERPQEPSPVLTPNQSDGQQAVQASPRPSPAPQPEQQRVITARRAPQQAPARTQDDTPPQHRTSALDLINSREQIAASANFSGATSASSRRPTKHFISASTKAHAAASYMRQWIQKVERVGNLNYPDQARRRRLSGRLILQVTLRPDGSVAAIDVVSPSPHAVLDQAAQRIVRLAGPFAPVPAEAREGKDQLVITRTWEFLDGQELITR